LALAGPAPASGADLDRAFGVDGISVLDRGNARFKDLTVVESGPDAGKIVAVGSIENPANSDSAASNAVARDFLVARFHPDGTLDPSFGRRGITTTGFSPGHAGFRSASASDVEIGPDGKILVGGTKSDYYDCFALARYNRDGSLDTDTDADPDSSFDRDGIAEPSCRGGLADIDVYDAGPRAGEVVAVGYSYGIGCSTIRTVRLGVDGTPDLSFDPELDTFGPPPPGRCPYDTGNAVVVSGDTVTVAGDHTRNDGPTFAVGRMNDDGSLDESFGDGGAQLYGFEDSAVLRTSVKAAEAYPSSAGDGLVVAGVAEYDGRDTAYALVRLEPDGDVDRSFASDGASVLQIPGYGVEDLDVDGAGRLALLGTAVDELGQGVGFTLARLLADGARDPSFGHNGVSVTTFTEGSYASAGGLATDESGNITLAGAFSDSGQESAPSSGVLARFGPSVDATPPETWIRPPRGPLERRPALVLRSNDPGADFECNLDHGGWLPCRAGERMNGLAAAGRYSLRVRAVDRAGNTDPTPAKRSFRMRSRRAGG